jgi:hypothetical protein
MAVDEVRLERPDRLHEVKGKAGIKIPGERRRDNAGPASNRPAHDAARAAQKQIPAPASLEAVYQECHLERTPVEVSSCLRVEYFHRPLLTV